MAGSLCLIGEKYEYTKVVLTSCQSYKDSHHTDQKKEVNKINYGIHTTAQKSKDWATRTGCELVCSGQVGSPLVVPVVLPILQIKS